MNGAYPPVLGALVIAAVWIAGGIGKPLAAWQRLPGGLPVWMAASTWHGDEQLVVRWKAHGTYCCGLPGAAPQAAGREVTFTGTDTLRTAGGKLAGYWANADSVLFIQQLGVRHVPAGMTTPKGDP